MNKQTKFISHKDITKEWFIADASELPVGRMASQIAFVLRGKHKPSFTPNMDCGDNVIVINADKLSFLGNKLEAKQYIRHTGYPGGQRTTTPAELLRKGFSEKIIRNAVRGMLPKNRLGRAIINNLKIYRDDQHPHESLKPKKLNINI